MDDCSCAEASWMPLIGVLIGGGLAALFFWLSPPPAPGGGPPPARFVVQRDDLGRVVNVQQG